MGLNPAQSILLLLFAVISLETNEIGLHPMLKYTVYCMYIIGYLTDRVMSYGMMILITISQPVHITCPVVAPHLDRPSILTSDMSAALQISPMPMRLPKNKSIKS